MDARLSNTKPVTETSGLNRHDRVRPHPIRRIGRHTRRGATAVAVVAGVVLGVATPAVADDTPAASPQFTLRPGPLSGGPPGVFPIEDYLIGAVSYARFAMEPAATALLRAQGALPNDGALSAQALSAAVMAGATAPAQAGAAAGDTAMQGGVANPARVATLVKRLAGDPLAELVTGDQAVRDGDWQAAHRAYGRVTGTGFDGLRSLLIASAQWGAGDPARALATLGVTGSEAPNGIWALFAGEIAAAMGHAAQAEALGTARLSGLPTSNVVLVQMAADLAARRGELVAARRLIHAMVVGRPGMALCEPALDAGLRNVAPFDAKRMVARAYAAAGFAVGEMLASSIDQSNNPSDPPPPGDDGIPPPSGDNSLSRLPPAAVRELSRGALRDELLRMRLALAMDPSLTPARIALAEILSDAGQSQAALDELAQVDPHAALAPAALWAQAGIQADLGHADAAIAIAKQLAERFPTRPEPQQLLGDIAMRGKDFNGAAVAYQRAVDLIASARRHPVPGADFGDTMDVADARDDWPLLAALGAALEQAGRWPEAHTVLERALALAPDRPVLLNFIGYGDLEHASDDPHAVAAARLRLQKALTETPDDPNIRDSLGYALLLQHNPRRALELFEQAAEKMPEDPVINGHLGDAYMALGRHVEAIDQWEWALLCNPEADQAADLRRKLRAAGADPVEPTPSAVRASAEIPRR